LSTSDQATIEQLLHALPIQTRLIKTDQNPFLAKAYSTSIVGVKQCVTAFCVSVRFVTDIERPRKAECLWEKYVNRRGSGRN